MTVKELIRELEDMPQNAVVLLDQTSEVLEHKAGIHWVKPEAISIAFLNQKLDYTEVFINGKWLEDMDNPPEEFVVLQ